MDSGLDASRRSGMTASDGTIFGGQFCRAARPVDRRTGARRQGGRAGDQEAQARTGALLVCRPARCAARQDRDGRRRARPDASRRHHDDDAARQGHRAQDRVSGVHAGRRLRHGGDAGRRRFRHGRRPGDVPDFAVGAEYRLVPLRYVFPKRQAGAVLDAADSSRRAGAAEDGRLRLPRRPGSRIPSVQAGESATHAGGRHLAAARARGEPAQPGLPVSHREPLRSDRRGARADPPRHHRARHAAALGGSRAGAQPVRIHLPPADAASTPPTP